MSEQITSLEQVESIVNGYARKLARQQGVRDDIFSIHLTRKLSRGDMSVIPGPHVEIYLLWPAVQPVLNSKLRSAFTLIRTRNVYTPLAIATHAFFTKEAGENKRWVREKLGPDVAEKLGALIPKHRLQVITTTVIEVKDTVTGSSVLMQAQKIGDYRDAPTAAWSTLSQIVYDNHKEEPEEIEVDESETPELDSALAGGEGLTQ